MMPGPSWVRAGPASRRVARAPATAWLAGAWRVARWVWTHPENRRRRCRAMAVLLIWQAWERVVGAPWTIRFVGGLRLRVYPHSPGATLVLYSGFAESRDMRFVLSFLRPGDTFIDVGANVGVYTLIASSVPDVDVHAFEPSPEAAERLAENIRINALDGRVTVHRAAVGAHDGRTFLTQDSGPMNRITGPATRGACAVQLVRLDTVLRDRPRSVAALKVDVEGYERDVLAGAAALLAEDRPALIIEGDFSRVEDLLLPLGYRSYDYDPPANAVTVSRSRRGMNVIALAQTETAASRVIGLTPRDNAAPGRAALRNGDGG